MEIIKTIIDKLNVNILLISILISLSLYKFSEVDFITSVIILIVSYLFLLLIWNISLYLYNKKSTRVKVCKGQLFEETNENTILFYSGLSKERKQILMQLYKLKKIDRNNELIRVVPRDNSLYDTLYYQTDMFCSRLGGLDLRSIAYVVIKPEHDSLSIMFDKGFYKLIKKDNN